MSEFEHYISIMERDKRVMAEIDTCLNKWDVELASLNVMSFMRECGASNDIIKKHITDIDNYLRDRFFLN